MSDLTRVIAPGLILRRTPSGWYTLDWEIPLGEYPDIGLAIDRLSAIIEYGPPLPAATGPRVYHEDSYRTAIEALADLQAHESLRGRKLISQEEVEKEFGFTLTDVDDVEFED